MKKLILLNGTSSSGKTTIAKYLQKLLPEPYSLLSMDTFMETGSKRFPFEEVVPPIISAMMQTIAVFLYNNINVIADCVLYQPKEKIKSIRDFLGKLGIEKEVVFYGVKIYASERELLNREFARDDRQPGLAKSQIQEIHNGMDYDLELDTTEIGPLENATRLIEFIRGNGDKTQ